jgi:DnaJ-class molecular chaperone
MAVKYHPDKNTGVKPDETNEVLRENKKSATYDRYDQGALEHGGGII